MLQKKILFILFLSASGIVFSQSWKDALRLGQTLYKEGDFKQAYQTLIEAQKAAPLGVDLSQDIGNAAYRSGDFEMAGKAYQNAVTKNESKNNLAHNWHNAGNTQMQTQNYQGAVESYKNALRIDPTNEETRYNLAEAQRRLKKQQQNQDKQNKQNQDKQNNQNNDNQQKNQNKDNSSKDSQQGNQQQKEKKSEGKLSGKKTDRILDDLLKKEMQTQQKIRGTQSEKETQSNKSLKQW